MQTLMYKYFIVFRHTYIYRVYTCKCKKIKIRNVEILKLLAWIGRNIECTEHHWNKTEN